MPILTCKQGDSSDIFPDILQLYVPFGSYVFDMTYGKGVFWKKASSSYKLLKNDIDEDLGQCHYDFRNLPDEWMETFDCVVFDPPYGSISSNKKSEVGERYNNNYNGLKSIDDLMRLYYAGIMEAKRILKSEGILIVKCSDQISGGKQRRIHDEILQFAKGLWFIDEDLFVLMQKGVPTMRHDYRLHARKNNSFLWVFRKK